jgi:metalloendopeptidase OMA1, mitochondrial
MNSAGRTTITKIARQRTAASYPLAGKLSSGTRGLRRLLLTILPLLGLLGGSGLTTGCMTVPVTGRTAFNAFSPAEDVQLGTEAFEQILGEEKLVASGPEKQMVERVMARLAAAADDAGYAWEVRLIDESEVVNAFALPGGKMAVYTGILPICEDETGLAVVMGHEIGHVVAQHGTERMTRGLGVELIFGLLDIGDYQELANIGLNLLVELPFSRHHESEADHIGLVYMARAGYDPREAIAFWSRMNAAGGERPPEFLSTHPSPDTRIQRLEELLPEAIKIYEAGGGDR